MKTRLRQQAAVATLGIHALGAADLPALFDGAVELIGQALDLELVKVLELLPDGKELIVRAAIGFGPCCAGIAKVDAGIGSQAGYTLAGGRPIIVDDLASETRFHGPPLLLEHGVASGLSVVIEGHDRPFGVLGAHTTRRRRFTDDDVNFVQAMANVIALAIQQRKAEEQLRESEERFRRLAENIRDVFWMSDPDMQQVLYVSPAYEDIWGRTRDSLIRDPRSWLDAVHPDDRPRIDARAGSVRRFGDVTEFRVARPDGAVRWVEARVFPVCSAGGSSRRFR